jgi:putative transposase
MTVELVFISSVIYMKEEKRNKIKESLRLTRLKRQSQRCKVIELKIDSSKLNLQQATSLKMMFVEAKWLYNFILSQENPFDFSSKTSTVTVLNKDKQLEQKELKYLPAKNKQDIVKLLHQSIRTLSIVKKKGKKVGRLKFKSSCNSIDLSQYGNTHKIVGNRIRINGIKKLLLVYGLDQVKENYEIANAKLIQKPSSYYVKLTCYEFIKPETLNVKKKEAIGIDFGIKNNLTLSNGEVINVCIEETERLKRLQRKLAKQFKGSNNRYKTQIKLQQEYEKIKNKKLDAANKIVNYLLMNHEHVYIQDEQLHKWHSTDYGAQVQHSCMGLVKSKLKRSNSVGVVDKWFPTTKLCYKCGKINDIPRSQRIYTCLCGLVEDRDVKAAKTILHVGQCNNSYVPMEYREFTSVENATSALRVASPYISVSCVR